MPTSLTKETHNFPIDYANLRFDHSQSVNGLLTCPLLENAPKMKNS